MGVPKSSWGAGAPNSESEAGCENAPGDGKRLERPIEDTGVPHRLRRRRFSAEYKLAMLKAADRCSEPAEIGVLCRREGIYSSLLSKWRTQRWVVCREFCK